MARADDMIDDVIRGRGDMSMFMLILQGLVERDCIGLGWDPVVVELGVRSGNSTLAILNALHRINRGRLYSVDIEPCEAAHSMVMEAGLYNRWYFKLGESVSFADDVAECDIVFIDTSHEYEQTIREIAAWEKRIRANGRMIFHDTLSTDGVRWAIDDFMEVSHRKWRRDNIDVGPGLCVLTRSPTVV